MTLYLSRLKLRRNPSVNALSKLIDPEGPAALDAHHRLIWSLFSGNSDQKRDFLWRSDGQGRFYTLSKRPPNPAAAGLFEEPAETKPFEPDLRPGDQLQFTLRVNATRSLPPEAKGVRGAKVDVVMHALREEEIENQVTPRAQRRDSVAESAGRAWLVAQGESHGYRAISDKDGVPMIALESYRTIDMPRARGRRSERPRFGILDLYGKIEVVDPVAFLKKLTLGFGRAKAFGCGLMLIRRS